MKKVFMGLICTVMLLSLSAVCYAADLVQLPAPTGITWNVSETGETHYGTASWNPVDGCEGNYRIELYRDGSMVWFTNWHGLYDDDNDGRVGCEFIKEFGDFGSGSYTVHITAKGDDITYSSSTAAVSDTYNYVCPSAKLGTPQNVRWIDDGVVAHDPVENAGGYLYNIYDQTGSNVAWTSYVDNEPITDEASVQEEFADYLVEIAGWEENLEYVYITVTALSYNIELYDSSDESLPTANYVIDVTKNAIANELESLLDEVRFNGGSAVDTLDSFLGYMEEENVGNVDLAIAMQQDENLVAGIEELEYEFKAETGIDVSVADLAESADYLVDRGIDISKVSIIGAALNSENNNDVSLNFSEADPDLSLDAAFYKNSVAVNISMEGVTDQKNLKVPVQIKMPVPDGIAPWRLAILHYHADGTYDTIHPEIVYENDGEYSVFVLTSFSDFVLCEMHDISCTSTYVSSQGSSNLFEVSVVDDIEEGSAIVLALYDGDMLVDIQFAEYQGNTVEFTSDAEYDRGIVATWDSLTGMVPIGMPESL